MTTIPKSTHNFHKWLSLGETDDDDSDENNESVNRAVSVLMEIIYPEISLGHKFRITIESFINGTISLIAENNQYKFRVKCGGNPLYYLNFVATDPECWLEMVESIDILRSPQTR